MTSQTTWRTTVLAAVATIALAPGLALGFPESTETQGEIPADLNGVWLVVHHLRFNAPIPSPSPGAKADQPPRTFNVVNLLKMRHLKKAEAQKIRDAKDARLEASMKKAEAIIAKEHEKNPPTQTAEGKIEGGPRVIVPQVPHPPGYDPTMHEGDSVEVFLLDVPMPESIDEAFQGAQKTEQPFEPTDKQLALLRSSWQRLEPRKESEYGRIEWKAIEAKYFDQGMQADPNVQGAKFVISGTQSMAPRPGQPNQNIVVYGVRDVAEERMTGGHVRAMMATAPFPVPIEFKGTFVMFRVADLPEDEAGVAGAKKAAADSKKDAETKTDAAEEDAGEAPAEDGDGKPAAEAKPAEEKKEKPE